MITEAVGEVGIFFFSPEATGDSTEGNKQPALQTASSILHSNMNLSQGPVDPGGDC